MKIDEIQIRELELSEYGLLEDFLYEAIYQPDETNLISREVIRIPEVYAYIDKFGQKKDDHCFVADLHGQIVGAVWVRILADASKVLDMLTIKHPNLRFLYSRNIEDKE